MKQENKTEPGILSNENYGSRGFPLIQELTDLETVTERLVWRAPVWTGKIVNLTSWNYNTMITSFGGHTDIVY